MLAALNTAFMDPKYWHLNKSEKMQPKLIILLRIYV
jgi:hypothetical protein